ncbi:MAG: sigma-70 family RNA polymerase sigma factor [Nanoarchaeota archaeon]|nr:sigma-70 family RNA polymerase sigma factor [Nanoarchaeota archaeon]
MALENTLIKTPLDNAIAYFESIRQIEGITGNLTPNEEYELGMRIKEDNNQEAKDKLILAYIPLVTKVIRDLKALGNENIEDLMHEGIIGLIECANKYDPERTTSFGKYAKFRVKGSILNCLEKDSKEKKHRHVPLEDENLEQLYNQADKTDIADIDLKVVDLVEYRAIKKVMLRLNEAERDIIEKAIEQYIPLTEIAKERGCGVSWVSRLRDRGVQQIRQKILLDEENENYKLELTSARI